MKGRIASGAAWMLLFKLLDRVLGIVSTLVLARLLIPADFGVVAMAMSVMAIMELATYFSFDVALIQRSTVERRHYDSAWTMNLFLAAGGSLVTAVLAWPAAHIYTEPRLIPVLLVLAAGWLISGFENIGIADFRRHLDFRREFTFMASKRVLAFSVTMALAFTLQSYWALVLGTLTSRCAGVLLSYVMHPLRPRPTLSAAREMLSFSGWMVVNNLIGALQSKVPHFVIGRGLGAESLGLFAIANDVADMPGDALIAPINRAVFPGYSRLAGDVQSLRATFLDVVGVVYMVTVPAAIGIVAVADPLVRALLGEKWIDAIPILQVLALISVIGAATWNNGSAYLALGKPRFITVVTFAQLLILIPLSILLTHFYGLLGAAVAEVATMALSLLVSLPVLFKLMKLRLSEYLGRLWRPLAASMLMAAGVHMLLTWLPIVGVKPAGALLVSGIASGIVFYVSALALLWWLSGRPTGSETILITRVQAWRRPRAMVSEQ